MSLLVATLVLVLAGSSPCMSQNAPAPFTITLPTEKPSGNVVDDRIWVTFYPASGSAGKPAPAVVMLHPLGQEFNSFALLHHVAAYLAQHGVSGAVMMLPYHFRRLPPGDNPLSHYVSLHAEVVAQTLGQGASDVRTVVSWLAQRPDVDAHRIGMVGVSMGAVIGHLAMGQDERISAGVAILGGGDLQDLYHRSILFRWYHGHLPPLSPQDREQLRLVDPITYADHNRPRRVLMIEAARDFLMPPQDATALWNALGRPPIQWVDTNHYAPALGVRSLMRTSVAYLDSVWNISENPNKKLPAVSAPTLKLGFLFGLDSVLTPAIQWQALSFMGRPDHMSLLHADLGWSGKGPFIGIAVTVNPYVDIGYGHRFFAETVRPYMSLHFVF